MKKILLTFIACVALMSNSYGQWNPSGSTGNYYLVSGNISVGISPSGSRRLLVYNNSLDVTSEFITETPTGSNYGLRSLAQGAGADLNMALFANASGGTSNMGLRIWNVSEGSNNYSIYSDSPAKSYFQGNVGIGTVNPFTKLEINSGSGLGPLRATGPNGYLMIDNVGSGESYYQANSFHQFQGTSGNPIITMLANGKVGIGTINPTYSLQVQQTGLNPSIMIGGGNYGAPRLQIYGLDWDANGWMGLGSGMSNINTPPTPVYYEHSIYFPTGTSALPGRLTIGDYNGTNYNTKVTVLQNGNVAIGTTDPKGYKLAVAGNMIAEQVVVKLQANWPDYVFKPQYNLTALADLKAFIDKNHHLPEIPSAKEVAEKGINLGDMNKLLVKKVEELTLYLIEKDNKEKEQAARIDKLEREVEVLMKNAKP